MNVGLIDLDIELGKTRRVHKFPNLALMKLSAYQKARGDIVSLNFPLKGADVFYVSCVFSWHANRTASIPPNAHIGGAGIDLASLLPYEIEHIMPDYDLYPEIDFSMGFTSRGCIRKCPWCKVPSKEGPIQPWASPFEFYNAKHKRLLLLDNNLLAAPNWRDTLCELARIPAEVDFNQGLDIRLLDDEKARLITKVRTRTLRFAFDSLAYEASVRQGVKLLTNAGIRPRALSFYVLVGFPGEDNDTWLERMKLLASLNVDVYPMIYRDDEGKEGKVRRERVPDIFWHGGRANIDKFLSVAGRLGGRPALQTQEK